MSACLCLWKTFPEPVRELSWRGAASPRRPSGIFGELVFDSEVQISTMPASREGWLAQLVEHLPYKQGVGGSIPSPPTIVESVSRSGSSVG